MKKSILVCTAAALMVAGIFTGCTSPSKKVENAENNVQEAKEDLNKANQEYLADIDKYRAETNERIAANDRSIAEFNARIEHEKKEARADYRKKINALNQKNSDMKKKLDDYKADGKDNWEKFKAEFSHDMDEIGHAFKDLTVKNVK